MNSLRAMQRLRQWLDALTRAFMPLALLVTLLLWLQWPLRDLVGAGALQANDLAQWLFALYVALAVRHAGVRGAHLVARTQAHRPGATWHAALLGALRQRGAAVCVLPWAAYVLCTSAGPAWQALPGLERFPETLNPGYFMIRLALLLLAALLVLQALLDLFMPVEAP
jgi:hypothetical protein